jgi:DNA polymerase IV
MFTRQLPLTMHIDFNSCFATIEQQSNPKLRDKPIAVVSHDQPGGCILTPSRQAKLFGVKTGMRFRDGLKLCPTLMAVPSDPDKYRYVHKSLHHLLLGYTDQVSPKSIDEFVINFSHSSKFSPDLVFMARQIKSDIRQHIGDILTVSIGIAPSRFLAKLASNLQKPDGLVLIDQSNYLSVYKSLSLTDLPGIASQTSARLQCFGIRSVIDFYQASYHDLLPPLKPALAHTWYSRLRGFEVDVDYDIKSYGHEFSLPQHLQASQHFSGVLIKLAEKVATRLRRANQVAYGVRFSLRTDLKQLSVSHTFYQPMITASDIKQACLDLIPPDFCPSLYYKISVSCFALISQAKTQLDLKGSLQKKLIVSQALNQIAERYGAGVVHPASMYREHTVAPDAVGFGNFK